MLVWNMGHGSPGAKRAPSERQWALIRALQPDIVLAQETRLPELDDYNVSFTRYPRMGWGAALAVREAAGELVALSVEEELDRPGLLACATMRRADGSDVFLASVHVPANKSAQKWLERLARASAASEAVVVGGDFNAGPSIGKHPAAVAPGVGLLELSTSSPEQNTLVRPQHPGTVFQIDHVFGRGFERCKPMAVLPLADVGGPQLSDHNALWVELEVP